MDFLAALFAIGAIYMAQFEFAILKRLRSSAEGEFIAHLRVRYSIQMVVHILAVALFALSAALSKTSLLIDGVYAMVTAGVTSLVFRTVRPRH